MTTDEDENWADCAHFRERWDIEERLASGAQGHSYKARRRADGRFAFLKEIKSRNDPERRARFFREASAYDTYRIVGVPTLIESNAHRHSDMSFSPYIASEFINGPTLKAWRERQQSISLEQGVAIARSLLHVLQECHAAGCLHRDIKPDNIILEDGHEGEVRLLDFGLSFHPATGADFRTEHGQEVGNRFLRLPELSAGSPLKQDARSDLSFAAGILFYSFTGVHPDILQDGEGRLPHQRALNTTRLQEIAGTRFPRLAAVFDRAFAPLVADRYIDANTMIASLDEMMMSADATQSPEADLDAIRKMFDSDAERRRLDAIKQVTEALHAVQRVHEDISRAIAGSLELSQTAFNVKGTYGTNTLNWNRAGSTDRILSTKYEARIVGDEFVVSLSDEPVFRTSASNPKFDDEFQREVRAWILARLRRAISG